MIRRLVDSFCRWCALLVAEPELPTHTDAEAIASDWRAVGDDMRVAMRQMEQEARRGATTQP